MKLLMIVLLTPYFSFAASYICEVKDEMDSPNIVKYEKEVTIQTEPILSKDGESSNVLAREDLLMAPGLSIFLQVYSGGLVTLSVNRYIEGTFAPLLISSFDFMVGADVRYSKARVLSPEANIRTPDYGPVSVTCRYKQ